MKPGDPFETKAMDELRSRQRRALCLVPEWLFEIYAPSEAIEHADLAGIACPGLIEHELRSLADEVAADLGDLPARMEAHTRTEIRSESTRRWGADVTLTFGLRVAPVRAFGRKITELQDEASRARIYEEPDREVGGAMTRYVHLLVWADQLASDDYVDPRFAARLSS